MTLQAIMVIRAAKNRKNWGHHAAKRFVERGGIPHRLYNIAIRCEDTVGKSFERRDPLYSTLNDLAF